MPNGRVAPTGGDEVDTGSEMSVVSAVYAKTTCRMQANRASRYGIAEGPHFTGCYRVATAAGDMVVTWDEAAGRFVVCR